MFKTMGTAPDGQKGNLPPDPVEEAQTKMLIKEYDFIMDQLVNAWEFHGPEEMIEWLQSQTTRSPKGIEKMVNAWYDDDKRRNQITMLVYQDSTESKLQTWMNECGL
jgi:hypothetical protein